MARLGELEPLSKLHRWHQQYLQDLREDFQHEAAGFDFWVEH